MRMKMSAHVKSQFNQHQVVVQTDENAKAVPIGVKASGFGSSINGGELLLLALATCFCNDLYREASKRNLLLTQVDVICSGEFGLEGEPGTNFQYKAFVRSTAPVDEVEALINHTDQMAEIHNTLRKGLSIVLTK